MKTALLPLACGLSWLTFATAAQAANPAHLERLQQTNQCPGCDLSGADLREANLYGANLINANLQGADLRGANLGAANLTDANLANAKLVKTFLHQATLENTNLRNADLTNAYLRDSLLRDVTLTDANLQGANLSRTNLAGLNFQGANLTDANLSDAVMVRIDVPGLDPRRTEMLVYSQFFLISMGSRNNPPCDLAKAREQAQQQGISFAIADFQQANLTNANLQNAILAYTNFSNATFQQADLQRANLICANLTNADFQGANLTDARLNGALVENTNFTGAQNVSLENTLASQAAAEIIPLQNQAKTFLGSMGRAQQAFYLENKRFATSVAELRVGIPRDTEHYQNRVFYYPDRQQGVMIASIPRKDGFKSYLGYVATQRRNNETITYFVRCESLEAKPLLPQLPASMPSDRRMTCPTGFKSL